MLFKKSYYLAISIILLGLPNIILFKPEGLNYHINIFALFLPVFLLFFWKIRSLDAPLLILFLYIFLVNIFNLYSFRLSSFILSLIFIYYANILLTNVKYLNSDWIMKISKSIIFIYAVHIFVCVILFNIGYLELPVYGVSYDDRTNILRYFGFSSEPSITAFILFICSYVIYTINDSFKSKLYLFLLNLFLWLFYQSSFGLIFLFILFFKLFKKSKYLYLAAIPLFLLLALCFLNYNFYGQRLVNLIFNFDSIVSLDNSAYWRIAPFLDYISSEELTLIGFGAGNGQNYFSQLIADQSEVDYFGIGIFPNFMYEYGIIGSIIFIFVIFKPLIKSKDIILIGFIFLLLLNSTFNTNHFWFCWLLSLLINNVKLSSQNKLR